MSSTHTSLPELQTAFYARLTGDSTLMGIVTGVFDYGSVPTNQPYPYVTLGDSTEGPMNAFGTRGYLSSLTLHVWDNRPGFARCYQILARMNDLLDQQTVSLATLKHVYTLYDFSQTLNDPGLDDVRHMPIRYLTFAQEVAGVTTQDVNLLQVNGTAVGVGNPVPISGPVTSVDGGNATLGSTGDAVWSGSGAGSQIAILKKLVSLLTATLAVSGTVQANAGTNLNTSALALETGGNLASLATSNSAVNTAVGTQADAAWSGSGSGSEIAILKKIVAELAATLTVSGSVSVSNFPATQPVSAASLPLPAGAALEAGHLATIDTSTAAAKTDLDTIVTNTGNAATGIGGVADAAYTSGNGSIIALLKGAFGRLANIVTMAFDNTSRLQTSLYGKNSAAGDTAIKVNSTGDQYIVGDFTEQTGLSAGSLNADLVASTDVSAYKWVSVQITGVFSGTLTFQCSNDNVNFQAVNLYQTDDATKVTNNTGITRIYDGPIRARYFRVRMTSYTSGTATGTVEFYTQSAGANELSAVTLSGTSNTVQMPASATSTLSNVAAATSDTSLLASNTSRKGMYIYNDSTAILYLEFGSSAASTTNYTLQVPANGFFEMPIAPIYTGAIRGIWSAANGNARITELT